QVIVAGDDFGNGDALRIEFQNAGRLRAAAAVVELKEDVERAVGGGPDGLLSGEIAHQEEGIAVGGGGNVGGEGGNGGLLGWLLRPEDGSEKDREDKDDDITERRFCGVHGDPFVERGAGPRGPS